MPPVGQLCYPCRCKPGRFRSVGLPTLSKTIKSKVNALALSARLFLLSLILPGRRRTPNLQTLPCGRCPQGCASHLTRSAVVYNCGPSSCGSCMPCKMSCTSSRLSSWSLRSHGFVQVVHSHCLWSPRSHSRCPLLLLVLRLDKGFSGSSTPYCVIARYILSCNGSSGACFSAQLIIILLIGRFSAIPAPSLQTLWP